MSEDAKTPEFLFFNKFHCHTEEEYNTFLQNMDPVIAVTILVAAVAKAANENVYDKKESEILANCVKTLVVNDNIKE